MSDVTSTRQRNTGFGEGRLKLTTRDADVGDVGLHLREFGASEDEAEVDEAEVTVGRDFSVRIALGEEAVFASLDVVAEAFSERAGEGFTLFCNKDFHNSDLVISPILVLLKSYISRTFFLTFLFCLADVEASGGFDETVEEIEGFPVRDKHSHNAFVVLEVLLGGRGFDEGSCVPDGVLLVGCFNVKNSFAFHNFGGFDAG